MRKTCFYILCALTALFCTECSNDESGSMDENCGGDSVCDIPMTDLTGYMWNLGLAVDNNTVKIVNIKTELKQLIRDGYAKQVSEIRRSCKNAIVSLPMTTI